MFLSSKRGSCRWGFCTHDVSHSLTAPHTYPAQQPIQLRTYIFHSAHLHPLLPTTHLIPLYHPIHRAFPNPIVPSLLPPPSPLPSHIPATHTLRPPSPHSPIPPKISSSSTTFQPTLHHPPQPPHGPLLLTYTRCTPLSGYVRPSPHRISRPLLQHLGGESRTRFQSQTKNRNEEEAEIDWDLRFRWSG